MKRNYKKKRGMLIYMQRSGHGRPGDSIIESSIKNIFYYTIID